MSTSVNQLSKSVEDKKLVKKEFHDSEPSLRGTFTAVLLLGGFLVVTWVAVFILFLARQ